MEPATRWSAALAMVGAVLVLSAPVARGAGIGGVVPDRPTGTPSPRVVRAFGGASLDYQGGPVMHTNRTHIIFWNPSNKSLGFDPGYKDLVIGFLQNVAVDSHKGTNVYSLTGQYGDSAGPAVYDSTFAGALDDNDLAPASDCVLPPPPPVSTGPTMPDGTTGWPVCLSSGNLASELASFISAHGLPTGLSDVYFLVTPDGFGSCFNAGSTMNGCSLGGGGVPDGSVTGSFCGFHSAIPLTSGDHILFANVPYNAVASHCRSANPRPNGSAADITISTASHEHNETITDPLPGSDPAWKNLPGGEENGDLCAGNFGPPLAGSSGPTAFNQVIGSGHYYTQEEWSNEDAGGSISPTLGCAARDESDSLSFSSNAPRPAGSLVTLTSGATDLDGSIVSTGWDFGDGSAGGSGTPASHAYASAGVYQVTMKTIDIGGQQGSITKPITVDTPPSARFSALPSTAVAHHQVRFNAAGSTDSDGSIVSYRWSFGDGSAASGTAARHAFARGGRFTARLTVIDNLGLSSASARSITVAPLPHVSTSLKARSLRIVVNEPGTISIGSKRRRVTRAGTVTFTLELNSGQRARLNSSRSIKLRLKITFVPRVGPKLTKRITVTVRH